MRRPSRILLAAFLGGVWAYPFSPLHGVETLTLRDSLDRAASNNPRLLSAKKDLAITKTQLRQARSLFYPKINLNLDYVRYRNETLGLIPPEMGNVVLEAPVPPTRTEDRPNPFSQNLYLGRLGFVQTLYAGGKLNYTLKRSKAGVKRAESAIETLKQEVKFETTGFFFRLLALKQEQKALSDALFELERLSRLVESPHSRLLVASSRSEFRKQLGELKQQEQTVRFDYLRAMGMELFSEVEPQGSLDVAAEKGNDLQTALVWSKQNREELKETLIQEEVDQLSVDLSLAERYPVFLLGGGVEVRNDEFPLEETNWSTVLSMNIPLFDGFSSRARVRESRYRADQSRLKRVELEDQIEMEVRSSVADCEHWAQEKNVREEELNSVKESRHRYLGSKIQNASLENRLDYLRWFVRAQLDYNEAQYEFCMAKARLAKAMGRSIADE